MNLGRRKVLSLMGVAPLAAKKVAADISGVAASGGVYAGTGYSVPACSPAIGFDEEAAARAAWAIPSQRKVLESMIFERERGVGHIDHDLMSKKSFSLAAKVTFQRQRNVDAAMKSQIGDYSWKRTEEFLRKFA